MTLPSDTSVEALETRVLFADGSLDVNVGGDAARAVQFSDSDGTVVNVRLRGPGIASLHFSGEGLEQTTSRRTAIVSGTGVTLASLAATGVSSRSSLLFAASGGDGRFSLGPISIDGPIRRITAPEAVLTGGLSTAGPARQVQLLRAENAAIALGGGAGASSLEVSEGAVDCDLTSVAPVHRLKLGGWSGVDGGDTITGSSIDQLIVAGAFSGDLSLASAGKLSFHTIENATINVSGPVGSIAVAPDTTTRNLRMNVGGDIGAASFGTLENSRVYAGVAPLPDDSPVPRSAADFVAPSSIGKLRMEAGMGATDVVVAARSMGRVLVDGIIDLHGSGTNIVADQIERLTLVVFLHRRTQVTLKGFDSQVEGRGAVLVTAF